MLCMFCPSLQHDPQLKVWSQPTFCHDHTKICLLLTSSWHRYKQQMGEKKCQKILCKAILFAICCFWWFPWFLVFSATDLYSVSCKQCPLRLALTSSPLIFNRASVWFKQVVFSSKKKREKLISDSVSLMFRQGFEKWNTHTAMAAEHFYWWCRGGNIKLWPHSASTQPHFILNLSTEDVVVRLCRGSCQDTSLLSRPLLNSR